MSERLMEKWFSPLSALIHLALLNKLITSDAGGTAGSHLLLFCATKYLYIKVSVKHLTALINVKLQLQDRISSRRHIYLYSNIMDSITTWIWSRSRWAVWESVRSVGSTQWSFTLCFVVLLSKCPVKCFQSELMRGYLLPLLFAKALVLRAE